MKIKKILLAVVATIFCGNLAYAELGEYDRIEQLDETEKMAWFWSKKDQDKELAKKEKVAKKKNSKDKKNAIKKSKKDKEKTKKLQIKEAKKAKKELKAAKNNQKHVAKESKPKKRLLSNEEIDVYVDQWRIDLADFQKEECETRSGLIENWRNNRKAAVEQNYADGKYADLYKLPTWPFEALFAHHKSLLNLKSQFIYQTSAYNSNGSKGDLSKLVFSDDPIRLRDFLLAFKLQQNGVVNQAGGNDLLEKLGATEDRSVGDDGSWEADYDQVNFLAESQEFRKTINYSRYIVGKEILIGFDIPVAYKKHYLKTSFHQYSLDGDTDSATFIFNREGVFKTAFEKVLDLKDVRYSRKNSITGIGDLNLFANCNIRSRFFEKANWGFKLQLPTSKDADVTKLWAPTIGEEFVKFSGHLAMLWGPREWFNPHFLIQATYASSANVNRRIPKKVKDTDAVVGAVDTTWDGKMVLGDKIVPIPAPDTRTFSEWDTTVKGMADESRKISLQPAPEVLVRIGNIFEKCLFRRGSLDIFYDFRAKGEDSASGSPEDDYNLRIIEQNTNQIENRIGLNFTYQFDYHTRLQCGGLYTLAGRNVPQTMELNWNLGIEF